MPSNKETLFQDHICAFPEQTHEYVPLGKNDVIDKEYHIIEKHLVSFIMATQVDKYKTIKDNCGADVCKGVFALRV